MSRLAVGLAVGVLGADRVSAEPAGPACIELRAEAVYRNYGYDHLVHVTNHCEEAATCEVRTDVNPSAVQVVVAPKEERVVLTFRGSPSREFAPAAACTFSKS